MPESISDNVRVFTEKNPAEPLDFSVIVDSLCEGCTDSSNSDKVRLQRRFGYFSQFFASSGVKSVVVEERYVDRDYFQDFANYYSLCFAEYQKFCKRCHLFTRPYSKDDIERIVVNCNADEVGELKKSYLGFFVFRPLPVVVFGRTCLNPNPNLNPRSSKIHRFLATVKIPVNFFGLELEVNSTPFQEQDSTVSACATSALWTSFQITRRLFGHLPYSPSAITRLATEHSGPSTGNILPNHGLFREEMIHAIGRVGLGSLCETADPRNGMDYASVKILSAAYLSIGLPVVLIVDMVRCNGCSQVYIGRHAIVVCGYRFRETCPMPRPYRGLPSKYDNIEAIYCVDDQVGPYCQLTGIPHKQGRPYMWHTEWSQDAHEKICCRVTDMLVPLYHKIRVSHDEIFAKAAEFFLPIRGLLVANGDVDNIFNSAIMDIRLVKSNAFKRYVRNEKCFPLNVKSKAMFYCFPKYMWLVFACIGDIPLVLFAVDATDVAHGVHVVFSVKYDDFLDSSVKFLAENNKLYMANSFTHSYLNDCFCCREKR